MESFGILELLKTLLEKRPNSTESVEETNTASVQKEVESSPYLPPKVDAETQTVNSYIEFARAHDARARKIKK